LVGGLVVDYEISKIADEEKRKRVVGLTKDTCERVDVDVDVKRRALELESMGFRTFDALHIACAERARVDVFLTTDGRLLKRASHEGKGLKVAVANPLQWLMDVGV
jgi:predicted nucleic acid-binding protein